MHQPGAKDRQTLASRARDRADLGCYDAPKHLNGSVRPRDTGRRVMSKTSAMAPVSHRRARAMPPIARELPARSVWRRTRA